MIYYPISVRAERVEALAFFMTSGKKDGPSTR